MKKPPASKKPDIRPRFGWTEDIDRDPQYVFENRIHPEGMKSVVIIPLPFMSPKIKKQIREFTKTLWP